MNQIQLMKDCIRRNKVGQDRNISFGRNQIQFFRCIKHYNIHKYQYQLHPPPRFFFLRGIKTHTCHLLSNSCGRVYSHTQYLLLFYYILRKLPFDTYENWGTLEIALLLTSYIIFLNTLKKQVIHMIYRQYNCEE